MKKMSKGTFGGNRGKSGKIPRNRGKSGKRTKSKKVPCLSGDVQKTATNTDELLPEIPGVEQLDAIPEGSKVFCSDFYKDEAAILTRRATNVLDRRSIFIAPKVGWPKGIYWRAAK